jgi:hypothetical protein
MIIRIAIASLVGALLLGVAARKGFAGMEMQIMRVLPRQGGSENLQVCFVFCLCFCSPCCFFFFSGFLLFSHI